MALSGFSSPHRRIRGGILKIALIEASQLLHVLDNGKSEFRIYSKNGWAEYECREDSASYTETTEVRDGVARTTHTLEFSLTGIDTASKSAMEQILLSPSGMLAVVTTADSGMLLLGYSNLMKSEYPLRLSAGETLSGNKPLDFCGRRITLRSVDASPACRATKYE